MSTTTKTRPNAAKKPAARKPAAKRTRGPSKAEIARLQTIARGVDGTSSPMMMIDRDLMVTYANQGTLDLFRQHAALFRSKYPGFDPEAVVGSCIDAFHAHPEHQRRLLADASNLPHRAHIQVGPLTFRLNITAMMDEQGQYCGNVLEWADVTEQRASEAERKVAEARAYQLEQSVQTASTPMMTVDHDLNITFVNRATVALLSSHQATMQQIYPGFDAQDMVGRNIDMFHKNPAHQRRLLADPSNLPHTARIKVGPLRFDLNISAIIDADGKMLGSTLQWMDVTQQVNAEEQIKSLIEQAAAGHLDERLDTSEWTGFLRTVGEGVNHLLEAVVGPIHDTRRVAQALAGGDLTQEAAADAKGDFKDLADSMNASIYKLRDIVGQIRQGASDITQGAGEINEGNTNLSSRTQEQAAALEETAATVEELTATVKQNADNAAQANQLALSARELAEKGGGVVDEAISAMGEINASSKKIAEIISVIDEIAFQTNLLALNAAVEAARAGEQGRGFAVVATEVRNLAQRSASAAKEIKALIQDSVTKVEHGGKLVDRSGSTLQEIVGGVKKVSDIIAEIAAASDEQASGITQVNTAVAQMDQTTQQNAALVEQAAAASASMDEQAQALARLVRFFDVGEGSGGAVEVPTPAAPMGKLPVAVVARRPARGAGRGPSAPASSRSAPRNHDAQEWEEF